MKALSSMALLEELHLEDLRDDRYDRWEELGTSFRTLGVVLSGVKTLHFQGDSSVENIIKAFPNIKTLSIPY